jgi:hypothetical protein
LRKWEDARKHFMTVLEMDASHQGVRTHMVFLQ